MGGQRFRRFGGINVINTSHNIGINFNVGKEEIIRLGGDVSYNNSNRDVHQRTERQNLFADSTSYYSGLNDMKDKSQNILGNFRLLWNIDSLNVLEFRPRFSVSLSNSTGIDSTLTAAGDLARTPVNSSRSHNYNRGTGYDLSGELVYNHKFRSRPGRSFSVQARYKYSDTREDSRDQATYRFYRTLLNDSIAEEDQIGDNHTWTNGFTTRLTWTEPLGDVKKGRFLTFAYRFQVNFNNADKYTYDIFTDPYQQLDTTLNTDLSNSFRNDYYTHRIQVGFKQVTEKYTYDIGIAAVPSSSKSIDLINSERNIPKRTVFNIAPYFRYRYKLGNQTSLRIDYRGRSTQPSMAQLQPVADNSDPLRVVIGNPNLKPSFQHTLWSRFNDYNAEKQRSIMAMLHGRYTSNSIISSTTYNNNGGQSTTYLNVNGVWNIAGMFMYNTPFRNKRWQLNSFTRLSYDNSVGYNNGQRNNAGSFGANEHLSIAFRSDYFDAELRGNYRYSLTTNSLPSQKNQSTHNYGGTINLSGYLPWSITIGTDLTYTGLAGYANGYNTESWLWNAQLSYQFMKGKAATIAVKVYDILGQGNNIRRTVTGNYIQDVEYNTLNTYGLITFTYRFNTFGDKTPESKYNNGPHRMGPPPGGRGRPGRW